MVLLDGSARIRMKKIVLVTGGFDPCHSGHIAYLQAAKKLGDILVVGVNSDNWLVRKKGQAFMPLSERATILRNIVGVDFVIDFNDSDDTAKHAIWMVRQSYPRDHIIFANGGDRTKTNIPEMDVEDDNIEFVFGVGGTNKANSSSWILQKWRDQATQREWGWYKVLSEPEHGVKVKELIVAPNSKLSMQKHKYRNEVWFVAKGSGKVKSDCETRALAKFNEYVVEQNSWHQLINDTDEPLHIIEIQYGEKCVEEDIERK